MYLRLHSNQNFRDRDFHPGHHTRLFAYRMRFLWPDEIDADRAHYQKLLEKWGSDEAIDDMEYAFGSLF